LLNDLLSIGAIKPFIYWGIFILGLIIFIAYSIILDKKTNRTYQKKYDDRCKAEKTKYYD
jgi:hypothetical protein